MPALGMSVTVRQLLPYCDLWEMCIWLFRWSKYFSHIYFVFGHIYLVSHILVPSSSNSWNFLNSKSSGSFVTILGVLSSVPEITSESLRWNGWLGRNNKPLSTTLENVSEVTFEEHLRMQDGCQGNQPGIELVAPVYSFQYWNLQS